MRENSGSRCVVNMRQSTSFGFENQQVGDRIIRNQFALDIARTFTYHTHARAKELRSHGGV